MRAYLNEPIPIPFVSQRPITAATITVINLSSGALAVVAQPMSNIAGTNVWTYLWTTPKTTTRYQVVVNDGLYDYDGGIIEVYGGIVFAVVTDGGNTSTTFHTDLAETVTDYFRSPSLVKWLDGVLVGQTRRLADTASYNGSTRFLTTAAGFTGTPASGVKGLLVTG
jgi:hypothetical protein